MYPDDQKRPAVRGDLQRCRREDSDSKKLCTAIEVTVDRERGRNLATNTTAPAITQSVRFATLRPLSESERDGCDVQTICDGLADRATYHRIREICNLLQRHKDEGNMPMGARTAAESHSEPNKPRDA